MSLNEFKKLPKQEKPKLLKNTGLFLTSLSTAVALNLPGKVNAQSIINPETQPGPTIVQTQDGSELTHPNSFYIGPETKVKEGVVKTEDGNLLSGQEVVPSDLPTNESLPQNEVFSTFSESLLHILKSNITGFTDNDITFKSLADDRILVVIKYSKDPEGQKAAKEILEQIAQSNVNDSNPNNIYTVVDLNKLPDDNNQDPV